MAKPPILNHIFHTMILSQSGQETIFIKVATFKLYL